MTTTKNAEIQKVAYEIFGKLCVLLIESTPLGKPVSLTSPLTPEVETENQIQQGRLSREWGMTRGEPQRATPGGGEGHKSETLVMADLERRHSSARAAISLRLDCVRRPGVRMPRA